MLLILIYIQQVNETIFKNDKQNWVHFFIPCFCAPLYLIGGPLYLQNGGLRMANERWKPVEIASKLWEVEVFIICFAQKQSS